MKHLISLLIIIIPFFCASPKVNTDDFSFRFIVDFNVQPYFFESIHSSHSLGFNGRVMVGLKFKNYSFSLSARENYESFGEINKSTFFGGQNILRFSFDFFAEAGKWVEFQMATGVSLLHSSFVYNNALSISKQEFGVYGSFDMLINPNLPYLSSIALINQIDFFINPPYYTPMYYGALRMLVSPNFRWIDFYFEAGGRPYIYKSEKVSFTSGIFVFAVGMRFNVVVSDVRNEIITVQRFEKKRNFEKLDKFDQLLLVEEGDVISFADIRFLPDSDELYSDSYILLDIVARTLREKRNFIFEIGGYTNATGYPAKELELSYKRALKVVEYFYSKGVESARMKPVGYGSKGGIKGDITADNRRVEIKVIGVIK